MFEVNLSITLYIYCSNLFQNKFNIFIFLLALSTAPLSVGFPP